MSELDGKPESLNPCEGPEEEERKEDEYITVTCEMALDAGDPSLEGQRWKW